MTAPGVDAERLERTIAALAGIGATPAGGVSRIALTADDLAGRRFVERELRELGCAIRHDRIGNLFARLDGSDDRRPAVMLGSHLDSQPDGGRYDGALGVVAALEVLRTVRDGRLPHAAPLELAIWTDEEGARFGVSCIGSSVYADALSLDDARALTDADGTTLGRALDDLPFAGETPVGACPPAAYLELHIEQGPHLDRAGRPVGVVEGITGIEWLEVRIGGRTGHAGTTPPDARSDALLAAAGLVVAVDRIARSRGGEARATTCVLRARPNAGSVIVGATELLVDLRHPDAEELAAMAAELETRCDEIRADGLAVDVRAAWSQPPVRFDPRCVGAVAAAAQALGVDAPRMISGAGHDAGYVARVAPSAMVFAACRDGVSHHPDEFARPADIALAANVLLRATLELAA